MSRIDRETPKPGPDSDWYDKIDELNADGEGFVGTHAGAMLTAEPPCPHCHGVGVRSSDDIASVEVHCPACYGTGIHNKLND